MEFTLYLVLVVSAVAATLLSYVLRDVIALRFFSALLLIGVALSTGQTNFFSGFGDVNVITYTSSQAGDPGRSMELEVFQWGFGLWGVLQLYFAFINIVRLAFGGGGTAENTMDDTEKYL